jgi:hypothetical protein
MCLHHLRQYAATNFRLKAKILNEAEAKTRKRRRRARAPLVKLENTPKVPVSIVSSHPDSNVDVQ